MNRINSVKTVKQDISYIYGEHWIFFYNLLNEKKKKFVVSESVYIFKNNCLKMS